MSRSKLQFVDHHILERTVASNPDSSYEDHEEDHLTIEDLEPYLDKLPPREVDLIHMYCVDGKKQKEIATFFGISQGAVSHRLARARERIEFLRGMPKISDKDLKAKLSSVLNKEDTEVVFYMVRTTCQSRTASIVNSLLGFEGKRKLTQVKVRHKFKKSMDVLNKLEVKDRSYSTTASLVRYIDDDGLYMLHEVILPHFDKGSDVTMCMGGSL